MFGLRAKPITKLPKTTPIPTPDPAKDIVAKPAPINFAASNNMLKENKLTLKKMKKYPRNPSNKQKKIIKNNTKK